MATNYISKVVMPSGSTTYYIKDSAGRNVIGFTAYNNEPCDVGTYFIDASDTIPLTGENLYLWRCTTAVTSLDIAAGRGWEQLRDTKFTKTTIQEELGKLYKADANNVKITGDQTIGGTKTFAGSIKVGDATKISVGDSATLGSLLDAKQNKLTAGDNITIDESTNTISANLPDYILGQVLYGGNIASATASITISSHLKTRLGIVSDTITLTANATGSGTQYGYSQLEGVYFIATGDFTFASIAFNKGDWLISTGTAWSKVDNTDAVTSVNSKTGAVKIAANDAVVSATATAPTISLSSSPQTVAKVGSSVSLLKFTDASTSGSQEIITGVSGNFLTSALKSASLGGTTKFATAGLSASIDSTYETLTFSNAGTGTVTLSTTSTADSDKTAISSTSTYVVATAITPATSGSINVPSSATATAPTITVKVGNNTGDNAKVVTGLTTSN